MPRALPSLILALALGLPTATMASEGPGIRPPTDDASEAQGQQWIAPEARVAEPAETPDSEPTASVPPASSSVPLSTPEAEEPGPRFRLGLGVSTFSELGFGMLVRARYGDYGLDVAGTVAPEYFINSGTPCSPVRFDFPVRITMSGLAYFNKEDELEHGMRLGLIYNDIYQWGGILGYRIEYGLTDNLVFEAGTGFILHPLGHELVTDHLVTTCGEAAKPSATSQLTNRIWIYFGMGLTLYLF